MYYLIIHYGGIIGKYVINSICWNRQLVEKIIFRENRKEDKKVEKRNL